MIKALILFWFVFDFGYCVILNTVV